VSGGGVPATAQEAAGPRVAGTVSAAAARDHGFGGSAGRQEGSRWWRRWRERGEWGVPGLAVGRLLDLPIREVAEGGPVVVAWARE